MKIVSLRITSLFLVAVITSSIAAPVEYNPIDAVTSASTRFKIMAGQAYATYAEITWWDYYSNGDQHLLNYGTSTAYGATLNLKPFTANTIIMTTIPNLQQGTKYYIQFYRFYEEQEKMTNDSFTTFGTIAIKQPKPNAGLAMDLRDKVVEAYLPNGVLAASTRIPKGGFAIRLDQHLTRTLGLQSGIYLFIVKDREQGVIISRIKKAVVR